eukprot:COSAG04_NODE_13119_length_619_cov_1.082692_1_plen_135_part_00
MTDYSSWKVPDLTKELVSRGIKKTGIGWPKTKCKDGKKESLVKCLQLDDAEKAAGTTPEAATEPQRPETPPVAEEETRSETPDVDEEEESEEEEESPAEAIAAAEQAASSWNLNPFSGIWPGATEQVVSSDEDC